MYVCLCKGLRETEFSALAACHGSCLEAMKQAMGLDDSCCGRCEAKLEAIIQRIGGCHATPSVRNPA